MRITGGAQSVGHQYLTLLAALISVAFFIWPARPGTFVPPAGHTELSMEPDTPSAKPLKLPLVSPRIVVHKSKRELILYSGDKIVRVYKVGLGFHPDGPKQRQADGRTPEGDYYICSKNPKSSYYLSLGLSYPNEHDAARGLSEGLIDKSQYQAIVTAMKERSRPLWDTRLGGEVFIHGDGSSRDWTLGCIALDNPAMKELFDAVPAGTPVTLRP